MLRGLATLAFRAPKRILFATLLVLVAAGLFGTPLFGLLTTGPESFEDPASESVRTEQRLVRAAGAESSPGVVVLVRTDARIASVVRDERLRRAGRRAQRLGRAARRAATPARRLGRRAAAAIGSAGAAGSGADAPSSTTPSIVRRAERAGQRAGRLGKRVRRAGDRAERAQDRSEAARSKAAERRIERVEEIVEDDLAVDRAVTYYEAPVEDFLSATGGRPMSPCSSPTTPMSSPPSASGTSSPGCPA